AGPDTTICNGNDLQLHATSVGGDAYQWTYHPSLSEFYIPDPIATPTSNVIYIVQVTDTSDGCFDLDTISVAVGANEVVLDSAGLCDGIPVDLTATDAGQYYEW